MSIIGWHYTLGNGEEMRGGRYYVVREPSDTPTVVIVENEAGQTFTVERNLVESVAEPPEPAPTDDPIVANLAMMLRRMVWLAEKETGDSSLKVLAGNARQLLRAYGLEGIPMRDGP